MGWRSVMITRPSRLKFKDGALVVEQDEGKVRVPLEDIAVLLIDNPQVNLTAMLLSACADRQIAVITVDETHHPNGVLLAHLPHSRMLKIMRAQIAMSQPRKKRLWQFIVRQKISNQSAVLDHHGHTRAAKHLEELSQRVRSGDKENAEGLASQAYFPALFGKGFSRKRSCFRNAALNYGYAVIRAALARSLVSHGFLTAFGLHHQNERNSFNLADDLIEPFRPLLDDYLLQQFADDEPEALEPSCKAILVNILHVDVGLAEVNGAPARSTLLAAIDTVVTSLSRALKNEKQLLRLPQFQVD